MYFYQFFTSHGSLKIIEYWTLKAKKKKKKKNQKKEEHKP